MYVSVEEIEQPHGNT